MAIPRHRNLDVETLRQQLLNQTAIDAYKRAPFNPHAIARLRLSAYQKSVVMKYVDNLLDWGDDLFARAFSQANPEYLREATLKYVLAQELLGPRPARLGDCGEAGGLRYMDISETLINDSEFLLEVESLVSVPGVRVERAEGYVPTWSTKATAMTEARYRGKGSLRAIAEHASGYKQLAANENNPQQQPRAAFGSLTSADSVAIALPAPPLSAPPLMTTGAPARPRGCNRRCGIHARAHIAGERGVLHSRQPDPSLILGSRGGQALQGANSLDPMACSASYRCSRHPTILGC